MFVRHESVGELAFNSEGRRAAGNWLPVIIRIYVVDISVQCVFSFQVSDTTLVGADGLEE
jgi:hypothetical protein